ncbi:EAL domain-containing protein [Thiomonas sp. FB-Cd]|uniref:sensor domain-containing protein n=1 Tax=Thiomonas sp. FB-Cd TaxID=1158292 RepID=UPI00068F714C|nr:EAL domain-containing protein [Thiomonas sp. FB-Cd]
MPYDPPRADFPAVSDVAAAAGPSGRAGASPVGPESMPQWLDALPALFAYFDAEGRLRQCNAAYANWLGMPALEILGLRLDQLLGPEDMALVAPHVRAVLAGRPALYSREQIHERDIRWMEVRLQPAWEANEQSQPPRVVGFYCLALDRSANKQQDDRSALLKHAAGVTFWTLDLRQGVLRSEQNWHDPARLDEPAEFTIGEFLAMVPRPDRDTLIQAVQAVMRSGEQVSPSVDTRILRKDGSVVWTRNQGLVSRRSASGEPLELMGISLDIGAAKLALDDLQASEQQFRTFAELSSDWFWELDAAGRFTSVSASSLRNRHVQQVRDAVIGREWRSVNAALASSPQWVALNTLMKRQLPFHDLVLPFRSTGSSTRWWSLSGTPVWNAKGLLGGWRGAARDITAQREAEDKLYAAAYTDALTGLSNRAGFERLLQAALGQTPEPGGSLLFIDLDQFKQINDSLGHGMGDRLLAEAAQRIQATRRAGDLTGRFGGDEFLVYARRTDVNAPEDHLALAEQLRADLARAYDMDGRVLHTTVSVGVAHVPRDGRTIVELLSHADAALHEAKALGRNRVQAFTPELQSRVQRRARLEAELHATLDADGFQIALQPIARLIGHTAPHAPAQSRYAIASFEALARWRRLDGEVVGPTEFIPIIQDLGLISLFGRQIIHKSLQALRRLRDEFGYAGSMAVNVSPAQLKGGCVECLREELGAAAIDPALLTIELTENLQIMACGDCLHTLNDIRALGVHISLDDFGVGFSNLEYLTRLPASQIKIDRAFTHGVAADRYKAAVVTATLAMATSLGLDTIAEGVEDACDLQWIEKTGCTQVQGLALWPAMDLETAAALLQQTTETMI